VRVEPADAVDERVGRELRVGIQHEVIIGARAVQHEVVRSAIADVGVAVQEHDVHRLVGEAFAAELDDALGDAAVAAVVDQGHVHRPQHARVLRRLDRDAERIERALEQRQIRLIGDDADLERGRQHEWQ
jgi:hypothetical protein